jgi:hypothetical protein
MYLPTKTIQASLAKMLGLNGEIMESEGRSPVTENDICFCTCASVLVLYKHDHYSQYVPREVAQFYASRK